MQRIVICEDQPDISLLLQLIFRKKGYESIVIDELTSVRQITDEQPDLILMDLKMPGISGIEAVKQLKENNETAAIPVVLVSGNAELQSIAEDLGVDYLLKPFEVKDVLEIVTRHIGQ